MTSLNRQFEQIRQSATVAMADRILALKASGRAIIGLQVGDPDFGTPPAVQEVALRALGQGLTHYGPSSGTAELREAIALKLRRDEGVAYDPGTEILATHGGIHAYYTALQAILNPGDEVLVPDPTWATHANMVVMLRGRAVRVPAPAEHGFIPPLEAWERALTPATRALVLNHPSNPTGAYPGREYLEALQAFAEAHGLWVVSDEVYGSLHYGERPTSAAAAGTGKARTLLVNSLSKTYAMTGWRVGFLAAPAPVIQNALKASQNSITCVAPFVQKAAAFALTDPGVQEAAAAMRAAYARRRDLVVDLARARGGSRIRVTPPQGAFYFFLDVRPLGLSSGEACERILEAASVGLVPGSAFGDQGEGFLRMTIAASDAEVAEGFTRILDWAETL